MNEFKHTMSDLYQMQSLSLDSKIRMTMQRIKVWIDTFGEEGVFISFSGGKDSTVLMDIIRNQMGHKDIPAVFVDVPTQFPELREFAKTWDNVEVLKSKISFMEVCGKYGFPLISKEIAGKMHDLQTAHKNGHECYVDRQFRGEYTTKNGKKNIYNVEKYAFLTEAPFQISHKCCSAMKKEPLNEYEKKTGRKPITAQMAEESKLRTQAWCKFGCNAFEQKKPKSNPMMFWTEQDILTYIHTTYQFVQFMATLWRTLKQWENCPDKCILTNFPMTLNIKQQDAKERDACFADLGAIWKRREKADSKC